MATTYLQLVNDVLTRLRESTVASVSENDYSALIGKLVNDAKREVEDAWDWEALASTYTITTSNGVTSYAITNAGDASRIHRVYNTTNRIYLEERPHDYFISNIDLAAQTTYGIPAYWATDGLNGSGDLKIQIFPVPNTAYTIKVDAYTPEAELSANSDSTELPKIPIVALAWAKAIEERGEDGGVGVSSQYAVAKQALADRISVEANRRTDEFSFYWV
jgi:hypothetical protein